MTTPPATPPDPSTPSMPPSCELKALRCAAARLANDANSLAHLGPTLSAAPPEVRPDILRRKLAAAWFTFRRIAAIMESFPRPPYLP